MSLTEGEHIEMGGIIDAEKGALLYRRTTNVKTIDGSVEEGFQKKKIIQVTDETGWLGESKSTVNKTAIEKSVKQPEKDAGLIEESNPLYSDKEYDVGFFNPIYSVTSSSTIARAITPPEGQDEQEEKPSDNQEDTSDTAKLLTPSQRRGRKVVATEAGNEEYLDYLTSEPTDTVDTYF